MTVKFMKEYIEYCNSLNIEPTFIGLAKYKKYNY